MVQKTRKRKIDAHRVRPSKKPCWGGPEEEGVSQSMLARYLACKHRFKVYAIDGITVNEGFRTPLEYGNMWHLCEECHARDLDWTAKLKEYAKDLMLKYRTEQEEVVKWYNVCKVQFPIYVDYWKDHKDVQKRKPFYEEEVFCVPYHLPSGRTVKLRGMWDSVDLVMRNICLQENKTKSEINQYEVEKQLLYDLQTMTYLIALKEHASEHLGLMGRRIRGIRYNVIRRPLSGGKGNIRPHKAKGKKPAETMEQFYDRLREVILDDKASYFARWNVDVSNEDIEKFENQTFIPVLENLCDDYEWWSYCKEEHKYPVTEFENELRKDTFDHCNRHYRLPYGIYNVVAKGGRHGLDDYINFGSTVGLIKVTDFFPELRLAA